MGIETALLAGLISAGVGAGASLYTGQQQANAQKKASQQAEARAAQQTKLADEDMNRRNAKTPNTAALMAANKDASMNGQSGTLLTGATGVGNDQLSLGKNVLLGN
jgi:uncharacterized protein HemX